MANKRQRKKAAKKSWFYPQKQKAAYGLRAIRKTRLRDRRAAQRPKRHDPLRDTASIFNPPKLKRAPAKSGWMKATAVKFVTRNGKRVVLVRKPGTKRRKR